LALKPVWAADVTRRLALAKEGDALKAELAAVKAEYAAVTEHMSGLGRGMPVALPDLHGVNVFPAAGDLRSEAEELKYWADRRIDAANPQHPWNPGMSE